MFQLGFGIKAVGLGFWNQSCDSLMKMGDHSFCFLKESKVTEYNFGVTISLSVGRTFQYIHLDLDFSLQKL